jgi:hypothetical protein
MRKPQQLSRRKMMARQGGSIREGKRTYISDILRRWTQQDMGTDEPFPVKYEAH